MNTVSAAPPDLVTRSERLDAYLAQDPSNDQLLADAFDAAIAAHRLDAATRHVEAGLASAPGSPAWTFRQATLAIAAGRLDEAQQLLTGLRGDSPHPAVLFNLGYVQFRQGHYQASAELLEPLLGQQAAAQALWLRSLHQIGEVDRAWAWIEGALRAGQPLEADVSGAASLVAFDAEHFEPAGQLARHALGQLPRHQEALVAMGSVALAAQDAATAAQLAQAVLQQRDDGRARSLLGFAQLLQQDLASALASFKRAVQLMPGHIGTWHGLGWTQLLLKDLDGAEAAFAHAVEMDRNFGESHGSYAVVLAMQGRPQEAKFHAERAKRLDPAGMAARYAELVLAGQGTDPAAVEQLARQLLAALSRRRSPQPPEAGGDSST